MALIKCLECGNEMSDVVKKCPRCGYHEKRKISKKVLIIGGMIISLIVVAGIVFTILSKEKSLTELEKKAVECVLDYKSMLKNADSLQVHDIRWQDKSEIAPGDVAIYIDLSGQNGFGGNNRHIVRYAFNNGKSNYTGNDDDNDSDDFMRQIVAGIIQEDYPKLLKDDDAKISVERVMKTIKTEGKE